MLRWAVDHGYVVIPLSTSEQHLAENLAIRKFRLDPMDVKTLDSLAGLRSSRSLALTRRLGDLLRNCSPISRYNR
jgi:diketogulonate reductase-like aldo/keto reductase